MIEGLPKANSTTETAAKHLIAGILSSIIGRVGAPPKLASGENVHAAVVDGTPARGTDGAGDIFSGVVGGMANGPHIVGGAGSSPGKVAR
ncbi:hypothetical protein TWF481_010046 [Arthrobotrys musiformis]|uniref:Carbohydrate kinase PfkB domain-containing protein n=1 Tax=Arthrobotrys musiformis TaxID=47236 RepID=A0AAV9W0Z5_9PEZI